MSPKEAVIHCNAGDGYGMGHLMRSIALAQEAIRRGWTVQIIGDVSEVAKSRAHEVAPLVPIQHVPLSRAPAELPRRAAQAAVLHLDSYWDVPDTLQLGPLISNMQDGPYGVRRTHLAIDANLGAETWFEKQELSDYRIIGISAALIREQVLRQRSRPRAIDPGRRVLVVMGGTDDAGLATRVGEALAAIPGPLEVTVVAPEDQHASLVSAYRGTPHRLNMLAYVPDLPALAHAQDLVISAAGTSLWDFACIGAPMALVCAVDNQRRGYRAAIDARFGIPLGEPPHLNLTQNVRALDRVLDNRNSAHASRDHLRSAVDGLGAWRVVSAWEELASRRVAAASKPTKRLVGRRADASDARQLFEWRNDETTRSVSRNSAVVTWESHRAWVEASLTNEDRQLYMIEENGRAVATVRWDLRGASDWEMSITVAPECRGQGVGNAALLAGEAALDARGPVRMLAGIHSSNHASRRLFSSAGYLPHMPSDESGFEMRAKWRLPVS